MATVGIHRADTCREEVGGLWLVSCHLGYFITGEEKDRKQFSGRRQSSPSLSGSETGLRDLNPARYFRNQLFPEESSDSRFLVSELPDATLPFLRRRKHLFRKPYLR